MQLAMNTSHSGDGYGGDEADTGALFQFGGGNVWRDADALPHNGVVGGGGGSGGVSGGGGNSSGGGNSGAGGSGRTATGDDGSRKRRRGGKRSYALRKIDNTLVCVLKALIDDVVTVHLYDETTVRGTLVHCDADGNVQLLDVAWRHPLAALADGTDDVRHLERLFVRASHVRFVEIPDHIDARKLLIDRQRQRFEARNRYSRR
jgi:small nuclear ribonucleoprotein (snRNP)-like protein